MNRRILDGPRELRAPRRRDLLGLVRFHLLAAMVVGSSLLLLSLVPRPLWLPVLSLAAIGVAALAGFAAWLHGEREESVSVTLWDIAGAFAFVGCAAAMLSRPEALLGLLGIPEVQ